MAKRSQIQQAIDKVNAEIHELMKVRERLEAVATTQPKLKRERKLKTAAPVSARSLSETH